MAFPKKTEQKEIFTRKISIPISDLRRQRKNVGIQGENWMRNFKLSKSWARFEKFYWCNSSRVNKVDYDMLNIERTERKSPQHLKYKFLDIKITFAPLMPWQWHIVHVSLMKQGVPRKCASSEKETFTYQKVIKISWSHDFEHFWLPLFAALHFFETPCTYTLGKPLFLNRWEKKILKTFS